MKHVKTFKMFETPDVSLGLNEGIKDTMIGKIFTSKYDDVVNKIFHEIKSEFNPKNLTDSNDELGSIEYTLKNGDTITARDNTFFAVPGYTLEINGEDIDCSFLLSRKLYFFLKDKRDIKYKHSDANRIEKEKYDERKEKELAKIREEIKLNRLKNRYK